MQECMRRNKTDRCNMEDELGVSKIHLNSMEENTCIQDYMRPGSNQMDATSRIKQLLLISLWNH